MVELMGEANAAGFAPRRDDVFARIADRYDLLCDLFSLGAHRLWKAHMARRIAEHPGKTILDLASGTGDIPLRLLRQPGSASRTLWVTDLSPAMLSVAQDKIGGETPGCRFRLANAESLRDVAARSMDIVSISFGMKICDRPAVIREAFRVLRPGGAFFCLEAARIPRPWLHKAYLEYMDWCLPLMARLAVGHDPSAYDYLLRGIHSFPDQEAFTAELAGAGFGEVAYENLTFGIVALHVAIKPL